MSGSSGRSRRIRECGIFQVGSGSQQALLSHRRIDDESIPIEPIRERDP